MASHHLGPNHQAPNCNHFHVNLQKIFVVLSVQGISCLKLPVPLNLRKNKVCVCMYGHLAKHSSCAPIKMYLKPEGGGEGTVDWAFG